MVSHTNMDLTVNLGKLVLQNPIVTASGTFGNGVEFREFMDLDQLGAITLKSITLKPKVGNDPPRVVETPSGMINSIGLENKGIEHLIQTTLPELSSFSKVKVIANIAGHSVEENMICAKRLDTEARVDAIELNISCPNVDAGGLAFCYDLKAVDRVVKSVRDVTSKPLIVKLSAAVPDIVKLAETAIKGNADILSLINTIPGAEVDIENKRLYFKRGFGGLSGPAVRPIALKAVYDVAQAWDIPIIGMGGVATVEDVVKFMMVGADAVAIGMMNFVRPMLAAELVIGLQKYLTDRKQTLADLTLKS